MQWRIIETQLRFLWKGKIQANKETGESISNTDMCWEDSEAVTLRKSSLLWVWEKVIVSRGSNKCTVPEVGKTSIQMAPEEAGLEQVS